MQVALETPAFTCGSEHDKNTNGPPTLFLFCYVFETNPWISWHALLNRFFFTEKNREKNRNIFRNIFGKFSDKFQKSSIFNYPNLISENLTYCNDHLNDMEEVVNSCNPCDRLKEVIEKMKQRKI